MTLQECSSCGINVEDDSRKVVIDGEFLCGVCNSSFDVGGTKRADAPVSFRRKNQRRVLKEQRGLFERFGD